MELWIGGGGGRELARLIKKSMNHLMFCLELK